MISEIALSVAKARCVEANNDVRRSLDDRGERRRAAPSSAERRRAAPSGAGAFDLSARPYRGVPPAACLARLRTASMSRSTRERDSRVSHPREEKLASTLLTVSREAPTS